MTKLKFEIFLSCIGIGDAYGKPPLNLTMAPSIPGFPAEPRSPCQTH